MKQVATNIKDSVLNKMRDYTNPFNLMLPWLTALFKKYMGNYFNEQITREQFTSMGLRHLTFKIDTFNQQFAPTFPFYLKSGTVGLLKLDLRTLSCLVEEVEIILTLKTLEQYRQLCKGYSKAQLNAEVLQRFKEEAIRSFNMKREESNYNAWNIVRQFLQKITISIQKLVIHVECDVKFSLAFNYMSVRVRKLQDQKDSMVSTIVIGGTSLHINEVDPLFDPLNFQRPSCILSLQSNYKYDQHIVMHLRIDVKERLKYSSTLTLKHIQFAMDFQQFRQFITVAQRILDNANLLTAQERVLGSTVKPQSNAGTGNFTWSQSTIIRNYYENPIVVQEIETTPLSAVSEKCDDDDIMFNTQPLEMSEYNSDDMMGNFEQDIEYGEQSLLESVNRSVFSASVFKELVNDDEDQQGLMDLESEQLIFQMRVEQITLCVSKQQIPNKWVQQYHEQDYYKLQLNVLQWKMDKSDERISHKQTMIIIQCVQLLDIQYRYYSQEQFWNSQDDQDLDLSFRSLEESDTLFQSCNNNLQVSHKEQLSDLLQQHFNENDAYYYIIQPICQIYTGIMKYSNKSVQLKDGIFWYCPTYEYQYDMQCKSSDVGIKCRIDHGQQQMSVSILNVDIQCNLKQLRELISLYTSPIKYAPKLGNSNLNLITIHKLNIALMIHEPTILEQYFIDKLIPTEPLRYISCTIEETQLQQQYDMLVSFNQIQIHEHYPTYYELMATLSIKENVDNIIRPLIKLSTVGASNKLIDLIPNVSLAIPLAKYYFQLHHIKLFQNLNQQWQQLEQQDQQPNNINGYFTIKIIIDELLCSIGTPFYYVNEQKVMHHECRLQVHISKACALVTSYNQELDNPIQGKQIYLTMYNACVIDPNRYSDPIYGTPSHPLRNQQYLHFRSGKYEASKILIYKQDRFNRESFPKYLLKEVLKFNEQMAFQQTGLLLYNVSYSNPDDNTILKNDTNILTFNANFDMSKIHLNAQHIILQLDEQIIDTATHCMTLLDYINKDAKPNNIIRTIVSSFNNIWISYLPTYKKSTLLQSYLMKKDLIDYLEPFQEEQVFYSWVRTVFRIKSGTTTLIGKTLQAHVHTCQLYLKSISTTGTSIVHPILLLQSHNYHRNRKLSDAYQIDKDDLSVLRMLCFRKLLSVKGITILEKAISIGSIRGELKLDSIMILFDVLVMTQANLSHQQQPSTIDTECEQTLLPQIDIFQDDSKPSTINIDNPIAEIILKDLKISISSGQHFPPELFIPDHSDSIEQQDIQYNTSNYEVYHIEHTSNDVILDQQPQEQTQNNDIIILSIQDLNAVINKGLKLSIANVDIIDQVACSRFSKILGKEIQIQQESKPFLQLTILNDKSISLSATIHPIRLCISGGTIEYLLKILQSEEAVTPKTKYHTEIKQLTNRDQIIDECAYQGYTVKFKKPSNLNQINVKLFVIEQIRVVISYDGSGLNMNGMLKGLMLMTSYDNLELLLKRACFRDITFQKEYDLQRMLLDQYTNQIKRDKQFMQQLVTQLKAFNNVNQIFQGVKTLFVTSIRQGFLVGINSGSRPLINALGEELCYLAKKPIDVCEGVTEGIGLKPVAQKVFRPIGNFIGNLGSKMNTNSIPKEFLK